MRRTTVVAAAIAAGAAASLFLALPAAAVAATSAAVPGAAVPSGLSTSDGYVGPGWSFGIGGINPDDLHPGDSFTVSGHGLPAGSSETVVLHSAPITLGHAATRSNGTFALGATIPLDLPVGHHEVIVTASGPGMPAATQQLAITVVPVPAASTGSAGPPAALPAAPAATAAQAPASGKGHQVAAGIEPNILTRALSSISNVVEHPSKIVSAIEIGLVLLILAVLPAHLLNATLAEQSERFTRRFPRGLPRPRWFERVARSLSRETVLGGVAITAATAIVFGFADPNFGFTLASLRLILACGIALFIVGYLANALTGIVARERWGVPVRLSLRPYGLILTIVGVIVSRMLHFTPGFLIGLILGLTIQGRAATGYAWRMVTIRTGIVLIFAIAAWIGYSSMTLGGNEGGTFGSELLVETLVAITTEGVVALMVELLPLRLLEGQRIYAHSRALWGTLYFLTIVVFVLAVVPWEGNWDALGGTLWIWITVLAVFALVCVGVYVYFRSFAKELVEEAGNESVDLAEAVSADR